MLRRILGWVSIFAGAIAALCAIGAALVWRDETTVGLRPESPMGEVIIAALVGVRGYRELEAGERSPSWDTWDRICKPFGWPQTFPVRRDS